MRGHVDAESLALYAEGELSRGRTARVRAHLSGCPDCAATLATLAEVTTQLSHVPAPSMPSAVSARLDAALSAEAAHRAAAPGPAPAPAPPQPPRRNPRWSPATLRILAGTAVALVAAGGIGYAVSQTGSGAASSASAPSGQSAHHPAAQAEPNISRGASGGHVMKPRTGPYIPTSIRWVQTGTDYQPGTLIAGGQKLLAEYDTPGISGPAMKPAGSIPAQVSNCVTRTAHGRSVAVVDQARYRGQPAIVIVLGKPDAAVIAVSHSCTPLQSTRLP